MIVAGAIVEEDGDADCSFYHDFGILLVMDSEPLYCNLIFFKDRICVKRKFPTQLPIPVAVGSHNHLWKVDDPKHVLKRRDITQRPACVGLSNDFSRSNPTGSGPGRLERRVAIDMNFYGPGPDVHVRDSLLRILSATADIPGQ